MKRTARWTRAKITTAPDGGIIVALDVSRWTWPRRRAVVIELTIPLDDAAVIHAQLDRILDRGRGTHPYQSDGLHPNYRGAVN